MKKKNLKNEFSDEDKNHLSYLGSALSRPNNEEEELVEQLLDAEDRGLIQPAKRDVNKHSR